MTTPDTQAPERIFAWGYPDDHIAHGYEGHWHVDKGANGGTEFIRADLADARAAAAWQGGIDALLDRVGDLPISEIAADEVIYAAKQLTPPADASTALDRLIVERVREAYLAGHRTARAWSDDVLSAEDGFANFAARASKEDR